jgi:hypothetical protein
MSAQYAAVAARAAHRCEYCRAPEVIFSLRFEVDHVLPLRSGGLDIPENLALSCRSCNLWKAALVRSQDPATGVLTPLFNPRTDNWFNHFMVRVRGAEADHRSADLSIYGITSVGRATVAALRMNSSAQLAARRWWMAIGLFP